MIVIDVDLLLSAKFVEIPNGDAAVCCGSSEDVLKINLIKIQAQVMIQFRLTLSMCDHAIALELNDKFGCFLML